MKYLISPPTHRALDILFLIAQKNHTSLKELADELMISKRTVKEDIIKLNLALSDSLGLDHFIVSSHTGTITINQNYKKNALKSMYQLKLSLHKKSVSFNYLVLLTTHQFCTKDQLLDTLFISETYLAKISRQLSKLLQSFGIRLSSIDDRYFLSGNECHICLFSYLFLQDSFQQLEWPFLSPEPDFLPSEFHETTDPLVKHYSLNLLLKIMELRSSSFLHPSLTPEFTTIVHLMTENYNVVDFLEETLFTHQPKAAVTDQVFLINFIARLFIPDLIPRVDKLKLGQKFSMMLHPYTHQAKKIYQVFLAVTESDPDEEAEAAYIYSLTLLITLFAFAGEQFDAFLTIFTPTPTIYSPRKDPLIDTLDESLSSLLKHKNQRSLTVSFLHSLFLSERPLTLSIYVQMTKNFSAIHVINNRLSSLYNTKTVVLTEEYDQADIIVTDTCDEERSNKIIHYLPSVDSLESWQILTRLIDQVYLTKTSAIQEQLVTHFSFYPFLEK